MLNKWNKRKLCALIWSIPWLVFPNLASPTGRNTQGEQSIPGILVLCFRGHLALSKPEVQDCWQKPKLWDSDKIFFFLADCRGCNTSSVLSHVSAQASRLGHSPGEAQGSLLKHFQAFSSKPFTPWLFIFPCSFPLFPPAISPPFFHAAL